LIWTSKSKFSFRGLLFNWIWASSICLSWISTNYSLAFEPTILDLLTHRFVSSLFIVVFLMSFSWNWASSILMFVSWIWTNSLCYSVEFEPIIYMLLISKDIDINHDTNFRENVLVLITSKISLFPWQQKCKNKKEIYCLLTHGQSIA
jgi:hypothetical protein